MREGGSSQLELLELGFKALVSERCSCAGSFSLGQATLEVGVLGMAHKIDLEHTELLSALFNLGTCQLCQLRLAMQLSSEGNQLTQGVKSDLPDVVVPIYWDFGHEQACKAAVGIRQRLRDITSSHFWGAHACRL